ncbi:hypothetical protein [Halorientalis persicus]|uniref:hypothetical protein n=1 Tax=Halorientalis persicus TaxID=1367881 RepID=UPI0011134721|nr:hypothetical protein [Halorientalis persicus]
MVASVPRNPAVEKPLICTRSPAATQFRSVAGVKSSSAAPLGCHAPFEAPLETRFGQPEVRPVERPLQVGHVVVAEDERLVGSRQQPVASGLDRSRESRDPDLFVESLEVLGDHLAVLVHELEPVELRGVFGLRVRAVLLGVADDAPGVGRLVGAQQARVDGERRPTGDVQQVQKVPVRRRFDRLVPADEEVAAATGRDLDRIAGHALERVRPETVLLGERDSGRRGVTRGDRTGIDGATHGRPGNCEQTQPQADTVDRQACRSAGRGARVLRCQ